jgi:hypothetical protein
MSTAILEPATATASQTRRIEVDFLYLDLSTCGRCKGTDANLEAALAEVARLLAAAGAEVSLRKTLVASEEQARELRFVSSPTIRVNGQDIALELRESRCGDCEACACNGTVNCRLWVWQGQEYEEAPPAMIVDAILREVYAGSPRPGPIMEPAAEAAVPDNLQRFFAGTARQAAATASCCSASEQASCCQPEAKASCCGEATGGGCGCQ